MDDVVLVELEPPRMVDGRALLVAGLAGRFTFETNGGIPALWQSFAPYIGSIPGQVGEATYGISHGSDGAGSFEYLCGVEVSGFSAVPPDLARLRIPERRYAVFTHRGPVSTLRSTVHTLWNSYLPKAGLEVADAPDFERYDDRFDPGNGSGEVEIWIPVEG